MKTKQLQKDWYKRIRILDLFLLLQKKELIDKNRKLVKTSFIDFKASLFGNKILYPKTIKDIRKDRGIFVLLHEEYHCKNFGWQKISLITSFLIGVFIGILFNKMDAPILFSSAVGLFSLLICTYLFIPLMRKEEYAADENATKIIIKNFIGLKPSEIIKSIFLKKDKKLTLDRKSTPLNSRQRLLEDSRSKTYREVDSWE